MMTYRILGIFIATTISFVLVHISTIKYCKRRLSLGREPCWISISAMLGVRFISAQLIRGWLVCGVGVLTHELHSLKYFIDNMIRGGDINY